MDDIVINECYNDITCVLKYRTDDYFCKNGICVSRLEACRSSNCLLFLSECIRGDCEPEWLNISIIIASIITIGVIVFIAFICRRKTSPHEYQLPTYGPTYGQTYGPQASPEFIRSSKQINLPTTTGNIRIYGDEKLLFST